MNTKHTLKELVDIAKAAAEEAKKESRKSEWGVAMPTSNSPAFILTRVTQAILSAIGYEFPKDEEREALPTQEPAWIYWDGGKCPLSANVKRWEVKYRDGSNGHFSAEFKPPAPYWAHEGDCDDIIAYRAW